MKSFALESADIGVLVDALNLPRHWQPFEPPEVGRTVSERREHIDQAWRRIRTAGLMDGDGLDRDIEGVINAWVYPDVLIIVRVQQTVGQQELLYRVAATRGVGVFSQLVETQLRFDLFGKGRIVEEVVGELPDMAPVPRLRDINVSVAGASNDVAEEDYNPLASAAPAGTAAAEKREMRKFAHWPIERFCGFELSVRNQGALVPMGNTQVVDTEGGRYVILPDGTQRIRVVPSSGDHLRQWLQRQIEIGTDQR